MTLGVCKVRTVWFLLFHIFAVFTPVRQKHNNMQHEYLDEFVKLRKKLLALRMEQLGFF
jgi:hypothetical protein